jgi:UDP-N-acetyl-D-galactosamine dehydrogenase
MNVYEELLNKKASLAVIGLGYVGLPVALAFAKHFSVIGFDIDARRIAMMQRGIDPSREIGIESFQQRDILFTSRLADLADAKFYIVAVPTPVDDHKVPNLSHLLQASNAVGSVLKQGDVVVFESTVYPGCTEEICIPALETSSGFRCGIEFKVGYSPERINPGDGEHRLDNTIKVVSGCDAEALELIAGVYRSIITSGVHLAPEIKVAEASKIIENTQRDLNISLMNELSIIFDRIGINTYDVLEAAGTKWNFARYTPGLVGGHCISVDPYYLTYKAQQLGYNSKVIAAGRFVNDDMPRYVAKKVVQHIIRNAESAANARVLVLGATFKENVSDIRNSKVADMVKDLIDYSLCVDFIDLHADAEEIRKEYALELRHSIGTDYDAVILAVAHREYSDFNEDFLLQITKPNALFADLKGLYRNRFKKLEYFSL